jgi:tRNA 2-thiouridine synthesizing protein B
MLAIQTLHILNKAPEHPRAADCRQALQPGDALLLTENAVLALSTPGSRELNTPVYALEPDVLARGLPGDTGEATLIGFPAMVEMTARAQKVISW